MTDHKYFLLILAFYFLLRLTNLTLLPIFNDEAIYLDWGWREIHYPGALYYSLYDSKQPLLMWLFGIAESIFSDPLFAGRVVSVLFGAFTLLGIYLVAKYLFNRKVAIISALFYIFVPIFVFFDRQALMESSMATIGVWSSYFLIKLASTKSQKYACFLGIILGAGFFIKSSALLFIATYFVLILFVLLKSKKKTEQIKLLGIAVSMIIFTTLFLLINPQFWATLSGNVRYSLTLTELLHFPFNSRMINLEANILISFFYLTPFVFLASLFGTYLILKTKKSNNLLLIFWIIISLVLQTILVRGTTQRYLISYLPLLLIPAAYFFQIIIEKKKAAGLLLVTFSFLAPIILTSILIFQPPLYFSVMEKTNSYSDGGYLRSFTSGYGVVEAKNYIEKDSGNERTFVGIALNTGNPESAMLAYFYKNERIKAGYFDSSLFGNRLNGIECFDLPVKFYFVSRDEQQAGLNRFFSKIKTFKNPYSDYSLGIYTLKEPCSGKTLRL